MILGDQRRGRLLLMEEQRRGRGSRASAPTAEPNGERVSGLEALPSRPMRECRKESPGGCCLERTRAGPCPVSFGPKLGIKRGAGALLSWFLFLFGYGSSCVSSHLSSPDSAEGSD